MMQVAAGILIGYLVTFSLLPFLIRFANNIKLYDVPDERKTHNYEVSSLGGIAIFSGLILSLLLVADFTGFNSELQYFIAAFFIIFILGVVDDVFILKAWKKFLGQLLVTAMLIFKGNLLITDLHGFLGIHALTYSESIYTSFFAIILMINSFNLIDGVDGLAGSIGLLSCLFFGVFFLLNNVIQYALMAFTMSGALLGFLVYNYPPAKIFMGDSGSTLIGLMAAILAVKFVQIPSIQLNNINQSTPALAFGFLLIPLMDVLRVFALRIYKKQSPLVPDRNHLHHLLQNKGLTHAEVTLTLLCAQSCFAGLTFLLRDQNINVILGIQFTVYFTGTFILRKYIPAKKKLHLVHEEVSAPAIADVKVYPIFRAKEKATVHEDI